jgi:hypothetical protein
MVNSTFGPRGIFRNVTIVPSASFVHVLLYPICFDRYTSGEYLTYDATRLQQSFDSPA